MVIKLLTEETVLVDVLHDCVFPSFKGQQARLSFSQALVYIFESVGATFKLLSHFVVKDISLASNFKDFANLIIFI